MISIMVHAQSWTQIGSDIDGEAGDDQSGNSVSLYSDGSTLAIGESSNSGTERNICRTIRKDKN